MPLEFKVYFLPKFDSKLIFKFNSVKLTMTKYTSLFLSNSALFNLIVLFLILDLPISEILINLFFSLFSFSFL